MSFSQGLSGLNAAAKALDVVGNNIANSQTAGFKAGSVAFADIFAGTTGLGVQVAGVTQNFGDGGLTAGNSSLDMGLQGKGFFRMVSEGGAVYYGRNGQFKQDQNGNIINSTNGLYLTGYQATGTPPTIAPGAPVGPIRIPTEDMPPAASTAGSLTGNLKSDDTTIITDSFDYSDPKTYNYQSQIEATDTLGNKHTVKVYFVQTAAGEWKAYARDETAPGTPDVTSLDLKFDSNGNMDTAAMASTKMTINGAAFNGSAPLSIDMDLSSLTRRATDSLVKVDTIDGQARVNIRALLLATAEKWSRPTVTVSVRPWHKSYWLISPTAVGWRLKVITSGAKRRSPASLSLVLPAPAASVRLTGICLSSLTSIWVRRWSI